MFVLHHRTHQGCIVSGIGLVRMSCFLRNGTVVILPFMGLDAARRWLIVHADAQGTVGPYVVRDTQGAIWALWAERSVLVGEQASPP